MKQRSTFPKIAAISSIACLGFCLSNAQAQVIYEPFAPGADAGADINDNAGGTGLSGNWFSPFLVETTGLTYGSLSTSGGAALRDDSRGWNQGEARIDVSTSPAFTALLADGGEMWLSALYSTSITDNRSMISLTNGDINEATNGNIGSSNVGFGIANVTTGKFYGNIYSDSEAGVWSTSNNLQGPPDSGAGASENGNNVVANTTFMLVAHIQWGDTATDLDQIDLYLPGTDLEIAGHLVATSTGVIADQSGLNSLNLTGLDPNSTWDEIRIGASSSDIGVVPEPSSFALLAGMCGLTWVMLRRR